MNFKRAFFCVLFLSSFIIVQGQDLLYEEDVPILLKKEASFGFQLHTSGLGISFRKGKHITGSTKRMLEAELVTMKHPKEHRSRFYDDAAPFVYGKLNSLMILRLGYGFQHVLYRKGDRAGLEIRFNYTLGASIGITKPMYLKIIYNVPGGRDTTHSEKYNPTQHGVNDIYGRAEFSKGLGELNFHPGGYAKAGFSFEYGRNDRSLKSLEAGAIVDVYPRTIPIMAFTKNNPYFFSLYLSFYFGGKR